MDEAGPAETTGGESDLLEHWPDYFGFPDPYDNQADAVESAIAVGEANGYLAMEGPCGTGKTMAALTAAATLLRHGEYENVVVVTPVKQQLQQFVADLRTMNAGLEEPLTGISLVGKRDLCPYGREGVFPEDVGTHSRCEDLLGEIRAYRYNQSTGKPVKKNDHLADGWRYSLAGDRYAESEQKAPPTVTW